VPFDDVTSALDAAVDAAAEYRLRSDPESLQVFRDAAGDEVPDDAWDDDDPDAWVGTNGPAPKVSLSDYNGYEEWDEVDLGDE
jgi:hypothetical protein